MGKYYAQPLQVSPAESVGAFSHAVSFVPAWIRVIKTPLKSAFPLSVSSKGAHDGQKSQSRAEAPVAKKYPCSPLNLAVV